MYKNEKLDIYKQLFLMTFKYFYLNKKIPFQKIHINANLILVFSYNFMFYRNLFFNNKIQPPFKFSIF